MIKFLNKKISAHNLVNIIYNSLWLFLDKIIRMLAGVFVGGLLAKYLGPEGFGQLAYVVAYISFFQAITTFGADGIIVKEIASKKDEAPEILGSIFAFRVIIGFLCWVLAVLSMVFFYGINDELSIITLFVGLGLVFQSADIVDLWFQSQSKSKYTVLAKIIVFTLVNGIKLILINVKAPLIYFAIIYGVEYVFSAMSLYYVYSLFPTKRKWCVVTDRAISIVKESWPFIFSSISVLIYMRIDQMMLKNMLDSTSLGIYAAIVPLSSAWNFIPMTIYISLAPYVAKLKIDDDEKYYMFLGRIFRLFSLLATLICCMMYFLSDNIVSIIYGETYKSSVEILKVHIFTNIFISLGVAQGLWIINEGKGRITLYRTLIGAICSVVLNYIFIPKYGVIAVAWVAVISQFISTTLTNLYFAPRIFKMQMLSILQIKYQ